jgi:hypothetical protein
MAYGSTFANASGTQGVPECQFDTPLLRPLTACGPTQLIPAHSPVSSPKQKPNRHVLLAMHLAVARVPHLHSVYPGLDARSIGENLNSWGEGPDFSWRRPTSSLCVHCQQPERR